MKESAPKFFLAYEPKHPACPFVVFENAWISGVIMKRPYESFDRLEAALGRLSCLTREPVVLAYTQETV